ncbi:MAG: pilus assembly protein [Anaerolineae bacterium]|nr:pilus assembly protein [Anaerolineae bacterium]
MVARLREEGQGLVEYALILVLVAVVVIVILALLGPAIGNIFSNIVAGMGEVSVTGG